jgi:cytidylate kinase
MKHHQTVEQYFKNAFPLASSERPRPPAPFVTISREAGAGGHELAEALAARLSRESDDVFSGWQIFDKSLCERVAQETDLHVTLESLLNEEFHTGFDEFLRTLVAHESPQIKIDHHMFRIVRSVCALGKAIVVGRAAALIARDLPSGVHVRLVSERRARVERVRRQTGLDAAAVHKIVDERDERRALVVNAYFNKDIADPLLYDCIWNADTVSYEAMAEALTSLIRQCASRELHPAIV